ncbi:MAG: helix-turn-helix domain-containing protein [Lachnospiraceae bacterium]|nr:helix-turn-helix domain-containing protein [Lachnospiraceae bacterium]
MNRELNLDSYGDVLLPADVQHILRVGRNSVYQLLCHGQLKSIRIGCKYLIPKEYLLDFLYGSSDNEEE